MRYGDLFGRLVPIFCLVVLFVLLLNIEAQQKDKAPAPPAAKAPAPQIKSPPIRVEPKAGANLGGRVAVDMPSAKLPRFDKPKDPPKGEPPPKEIPKGKDGKPRHDHHWHWHRHHGWILLPHLLPTGVIIPDGYALPPTVGYYQPAAVPVRVACPHCGQPIFVYCD